MSDELEALFNALDDTSDSRTQGEYLHPGINYMGNKFGQLDFILPLFPWHETFCDVFGGGGSILLNKPKAKLDIFNDRFAGSTAYFQCLQDDDMLKELTAKIDMMPHSREFFAWCRDTWKDGDIVTRAAKWYYLVQASFAGRCEFFGRVVKGKNNIPNKIAQGIPLFAAIHERLRNVQIENLDWRQCFKDFDSPTTLFYLDPPYYGDDVYSTGFTKKDHIELCSRAFQLQGAVLLSGYENPVYDEFPWDAIHLNDQVDNRVTTMAYDEMNNMAGREGTTERGVRKEYLWIKEAD